MVSDGGLESQITNQHPNGERQVNTMKPSNNVCLAVSGSSPSTSCDPNYLPLSGGTGKISGSGKYGFLLAWNLPRDKPQFIKPTGRVFPCDGLKAKLFGLHYNMRRHGPQPKHPWHVARYVFHSIVAS